MIKQKFLENFDYLLVAVVLLLCLIGLSSIYSASAAYQFTNDYFIKQVIWVAIGFTALLFFSFLDYRILVKWSWLFYLFVIFLLIFVYYNGTLTKNGVARWINLGFVYLQPSELSKLALVFLLAYYYNDKKRLVNNKLSNIIAPLFITLIPFILILIQPDLGTATILLIVAATVIFFSGISIKWVIATISLIIFSIPAIWIYVFKQYQKERILILLDPQIDPLGAGYHIIQSKIAIGSGLVFGKGFLQGKQAQLNFLPARHTDFIFAVFSEEWGFLGSVLVVACYAFLIFWLLKEVSRFTKRSSIILTIGIITIIASQGLINLGMVMGLLPVVGLPLPFMSYGGSSIVTSLAAIGVLLNIKKKEKKII